MRRSKRMLVLVSGAILLGLVAEAGAADFSPSIAFKLGDASANVNTTLQVTVKQETGEEELQSVIIRVPAGFSLAVDQQLTDGERLGGGTITIDAGPRCAGAPAGSGPANVPVSIVERNRNSGEIASGVQAIYVVDLRPVATIPLSVYGSANEGWRLEGPIPANQATCPPFTFDATFLAKAATSQAPILVNPASGGSYKFSATFKGVMNSEATVEQSVDVVGPGGGGGGEGAKPFLTAAEKKKCNKKKSKAARKKCRKKQRAD